MSWRVATGTIRHSPQRFGLWNIEKLQVWSTETYRSYCHILDQGQLSLWRGADPWHCIKRQVRRLGIWIWWDMMEYDDMGVKVNRIGPQMEKEMDQLVPHSSGFPEWVIVLVVRLYPLRAPWDTRIPTYPNSQMFWERLEWCAYFAIENRMFLPAPSPPWETVPRSFSISCQQSIFETDVDHLLTLVGFWVWHFFIFQFWPRHRKIRDVLGIALGADSCDPHVKNFESELGRSGKQQE